MFHTAEKLTVTFLVAAAAYIGISPHVQTLKECPIADAIATCSEADVQRTGQWVQKLTQTLPFRR